MSARRSVNAFLRTAHGAPAPRWQAIKPISARRSLSTNITISRAPTLRKFYFTPRTYSTAPPRQSTLQQVLYFRPRTYLIQGLLFTLVGAASVLFSMRDFIVYSDAESLTSFVPENDQQKEVEEFINSHPLAKSLRESGKYTESRPALKVNEAYRHASLTSGVLNGPGRIVVPPYVWVEADGKSLVSILYLGPELCGYPGLVHGGLLATLLDEGLARCSFEALPNKLAMTASLTINYRKPSPAENYVVLRAETKKVEGRKAWVEGRIETLPKNGETPTVLVEAEALMIEPKQANVLKNLISAS